MLIRPADPTEWPAVGSLTVAAYVADGHLDEGDGYVRELAAAAERAAGAELMVAVDPSGELLGTVTFALPGSPWAEISRAGEAEFRMLAVAPAARGRGVGSALARWCVDRARELGCTAVALSSLARMHSAHRIYEAMGFVRSPGRDWSPDGTITLIAYRLDLIGASTWCDQCGERAGDHPDCARRGLLEPPRWCGRCRRRMVVQILPRTWTARCSEHGVRDGKVEATPPLR